MFTHVMVGSNDLERSRKFYDATLATLGHGKSPTGMPVLYYQKESGSFVVGKPLDGKAASHANGGTIGFQASSRKAVEEFHKTGLAAGGKCEGPPGLRQFAPNAYGAYLRDPDGNKICAYCYSPG